MKKPIFFLFYLALLTNLSFSFAMQRNLEIQKIDGEVEGIRTQLNQLFCGKKTKKSEKEKEEIASNFQYKIQLGIEAEMWEEIPIKNSRSLIVKLARAALELQDEPSTEKKKEKLLLWGLPVNCLEEPTFLAFSEQAFCSNYFALKIKIFKAKESKRLSVSPPFLQEVLLAGKDNLKIFEGVKKEALGYTDWWISILEKHSRAFEKYKKEGWEREKNPKLFEELKKANWKEANDIFDQLIELYKEKSKTSERKILKKAEPLYDQLIKLHTNQAASLEEIKNLVTNQPKK